MLLRYKTLHIYIVESKKGGKWLFSTKNCGLCGLRFLDLG